MRAAIQNGLSEIDVRDVSTPGRDGALVRVVAAGVCGSDLHEYLQRSQPQSIPDGHEVAGEVVSLPKAYAGPIRIGDLVAIDTICHGRACGVCVFCQPGQTFHCLERDKTQGWVAPSPTLSDGSPPACSGFRLACPRNRVRSSSRWPLGSTLFAGPEWRTARQWSSSEQARSVS